MGNPKDTGNMDPLRKTSGGSEDAALEPLNESPARAGLGLRPHDAMAVAGKAGDPAQGSRPAKIFRVLDLFSGIGGFALAFEAAGFETMAFAEIEPYPCKVLAQHWPQVPNLGDVRGIRGEDFRGAVDVICGGFPCQDISTTGKGAGIHGERSGLWFEMLRIIRGARPAFCLLENVPALRTRGADDVLKGLEEAGYACRPFVVGAVNAGAPHRRQRAWVIAYADPSSWGLQQGWRQWANRENPSFPGNDGQVRPMVDTNYSRQSADWREGQARDHLGRGGEIVAHSDVRGSENLNPQLAPRKSVPGGSGEDLADAHSQPEIGASKSRSESDPWATQSRLGRVVDGVSHWMDEPPGIPRTTKVQASKGKAAGRAHRVKALGNSIVPAVAYPFAQWIYGELMARPRAPQASAPEGSTPNFPQP